LLLLLKKKEEKSHNKDSEGKKKFRSIQTSH